jgi:hypothetical protein
VERVQYGFVVESGGVRAQIELEPMKIEESFMKALIDVKKKYPVLEQHSETKVQVRVGALINMCKLFHKHGWDDNDSLGAFADLFKSK